VSTAHNVFINAKPSNAKQITCPTAFEFACEIEYAANQSGADQQQPLLICDCVVYMRFVVEEVEQVRRTCNARITSNQMDGPEADN
jgi:hypothetical protein